MAEFVHLHLHSEYSLLDGANRIEALTETARAMHMRALGLSDHGVLFGVLPFYKACRKAGIKPILGCELYLAPGSRHEKQGGDRPYHLLALAENLAGYHNLIRLSSLGFTEGFYYKPRVDWELLERHHEGLIVTSTCLNGLVPQLLLQGQDTAAEQALHRFMELFPGRFYVELQDHGLEEQQRVNARLLEWARRYDLPLLATNDCHYLRRADARMHDVLLCIGTGKNLDTPERLRFPNNEFYLKDAAEMERLFGHLPAALSNTLAVAERCNLEIPFGQIHLPHYAIPAGQTAGSYLRLLCEERLPGRYRVVTPAVRQRLDHELDIIERMGFPGYFLIVWDFVDFARRRGIPVGPGRGSGASSLVAYVLGITDVDPLATGLLFERFLNPERVDMPDFDIDFCYERRGEVVEYVIQKYGKDNVAQVITFGTMAARAAVRDVGRVLGMSYAATDRVAKLVGWTPSLDAALERSPDLKQAYEGDPQVRELIDLARQVEGMPRHPSIHAAGVVITHEPLTEYVPLYRTGDEAVTTQYDMDLLKDIGLLKMDFLGLRTLTVIDHCLKHLRATRGLDLKEADIPLDDAATYKMLAAGETIGVFQFEAGWVADVLRQMKPGRYEDLVAATSLCRPGPMEQIPVYVHNKQHPETIRWYHEQIRPVLADTYGIVVYQEQILQIAAIMAGFSLGQADLLRRAVGKKLRQEMEHYRSRFVEGCLAKGHPRALGEELYDLIEKFANYGFAKAHAAAYALVAYRTAYLKHHYPHEYMAALMSSVIGWEGKVALYIAECRRLGIPLLPPDANGSVAGFSVAADGGVPTAIRFGLAAVKNVGGTLIEDAAAQRARGGPFRSLSDFCERIDARHLTKTALESLIKAGAFDGTGAKRSQLLDAMERVMEAARQVQRQRLSGQMSLFDLGGALPGADDLRPMAELPAATRLAMEKEVLGLYLSGHPLSPHAAALAQHSTGAVAALADQPDGARVSLAGMLIGRRNITTRNGETMSFITLEDLTGSVECVVFPRVLARAGRVLHDEALLVVRGRVNVEEESVKIIADELLPLNLTAPPPETAPRRLYVRLQAEGEGDPALAQLTALLTAHHGEVPVRVKLEPSGRWLELHRQFWVEPSPALTAALADHLGPGAAVLR